jgi:hypothetical protein
MIIASVVNPMIAPANEPQTTADIFSATACQPCHATVPKLKLLPRDVRTLFKARPGANEDAILEMLQNAAPIPAGAK